MVVGLYVTSFKNILPFDLFKDKFSIIQNAGHRVELTDRLSNDIQPDTGYLTSNLLDNKFLTNRITDIWPNNWPGNGYMAN